MSSNDDFISKTKRKTAMLELQSLGEELIALSDERLAKLELPDNLRDAVRAAKRIVQHGALKRQRQYIGRLMRDVDAAPIRATLAGWRNQSGAAVAMQHLAERWRERLIVDDVAFTAFGLEYPAADLAHLRQLARNARAEHAKAAPPKSYRELYRALLAVLAVPPPSTNDA